MLKEIRCDIFRQKLVTFEKGLNVILGDDASTNSIGKSTMLMIVDFAFGGSDYITKNSGSISELGDHTIRFKLSFGDEVSDNLYLERYTSNGNEVGVCDESYAVKQTIKLSEYQLILLEKYKMGGIAPTFRQIVSPFLRIHGRRNIDVDKPLITAQKVKEASSVEVLVRLFERFAEMSDFLDKINREKDVQDTIRKVYKNQLAPKITKKKWQSNTVEIERLESHLNEIKRDLIKHTINIEAIRTDQIIRWKTEKSALLEDKNRIENKIQRLRLSLEGKRVATSKDLKKLHDYFENVNVDRLTQVENFHVGISKILKNEIESELKILNDRKEDLDNRVKAIDVEIDNLIGDTDNTKIIVDRIYELSYSINKLKDENMYFDKQQQSIVQEKELNEHLAAVETSVFEEIEERINESLRILNAEIYGGDRVAPKIKISRTKYEFDHSQNTGTGKGYIDLVSFDLSILENTRLPFLAHDSPVFKNVEDRAFERIVEKYLAYDRQIFISIDGIPRYNANTQEVLNKRARLRLDDKNTLFIKDWRR